MTISLALGFVAFAVDTPPTTVPVAIKHEKGSFSGQLAMSLTGSMNKAKATWNATITNTSPHQIFRVTYCVKAFDASDQQIKPGGTQECILRMWNTSAWQAGSALIFKGNQNIKISDEKTLVQVRRFTIEPIEVFDKSPNLRQFVVRCPLVWSSAIRVFADRKYRPTVMDKDSYTATYAYDGGRIDGYTSKTMLKAYTSANTGFLTNWDSFRIDSASLYLREEQPGTCTAEVKMSFAGFGRPFMGEYGWFAVDSNFVYEKVLLDELEAQSKLASSSDLDKAISQLPATAQARPATTSQPVPTGARPKLTITSEPSGAEIEIDGEFIGSTPTTVTTKDGSVNVTIKKSGFQPWKRTLKLNPGDERTLNGELVKDSGIRIVQ